MHFEVSYYQFTFMTKSSAQPTAYTAIVFLCAVPYTAVDINITSCCSVLCYYC